MKIDWDAYFDGTMSVIERSAIDRDPVLCRERDGFSAFRAALRDAAKSEPIPTARIEQRLAQVLQAKMSRPQPRWVLRSIPAIAALAALAWYVNRPESPAQQGDPFALESPPVLAQMQATDPVDTATWVADRLGVAAPVIEVPGWKAKSVRVGKNWAAYELDHRGSRAVLQLAVQDCFNQGSTVAVSNRVFFEGRDGLGWRDQELSYYLNGCNSSDLRSHACALMDAVKKAKRIGTMKKRKREPHAIVKPM